MSKIFESDIEELAIDLLKEQGYEHVYGPDIEPSSALTPLRSYNQVILHNKLLNAIQRINPHLDEASCDEVLKHVTRIYSPNLIENNLSFHRLLTEGVKIEIYKNGGAQGEIARLVDFDDPNNNNFLVINQTTIKEGKSERRPDIIIYVNGLPLVVIELKNATNENATVFNAYNQIKTYQSDIPNLFTFNAFSVVSDGLEARVGTISSGFDRYMTWKTADGENHSPKTQPQMEVVIKGLLNPVTLLDMIRYFIVFESNKYIDDKGQTTISTIKKMAAYHQYYAVNAAVVSTIRASGINTDSASAQVALRQQGRDFQNLVNDQKKGDQKAGVVWHTQGSGKSLSMVFYTGKIVLALDNPTIVVLTDRVDLDDQLFGTFSLATQLLRQTPKQAKTREQLKEFLKVGSGGVIFTTIQKFQPSNGSSVYEQLSDRHNIVVIADEAHRSQYGFNAKEMDIKDDNGVVEGKRTVYGFAKYLRDGLPNATYLGFTGTPIEKTDVNTRAVFGDYVDIYDIAQAVEDGATVPIYYESRLAKVALSEEGRKLVEEFDAQFSEDELTQTQKQRAKWAQIEGIIGSQQRIKAIAKDIVEHFEQRLIANNHQGKGMIVAMSRRIAAQLYSEIIVIKPEWHSDELNQGVIKVVMTSSADDGPEISKHHTTSTDRKLLSDRMKNENDPLKLVIVRDMWLTGFDAPSLHTLYIDKPMQGHNLMQAIARVNRVYKEKTGGIVVDYLGIAADLKKALSFYSSSGGKGKPTHDLNEALLIMQEKLEVLEGIMHGYDYSPYFTATTSKKLKIILEAEDYVLSIENGQGKIRFLTAVSALSQAYALASSHSSAKKSAPIVSFFQALKARLMKFSGDGGLNTDPNKGNLDLRVKQTIDQALVTESIVDIFDATGIKKPDVSILSDDFLKELNSYQYKNIALETLKKILNDEIKVRSSQSIVEGQKLIIILNTAIKKYQNNILTASQVIIELIDLAKTIRESDELAREMKLSPHEYAFYAAVAGNDSARELMENDTLRELAIVLTEAIRKNTSLDWTIKNSARAKIRVIIKRLLKKYGYPPDKSLLATDTILKQAELLADELYAVEHK